MILKSRSNVYFHLAMSSFVHFLFCSRCLNTFILYPSEFLLMSYYFSFTVKCLDWESNFIQKSPVVSNNDFIYVSSPLGLSYLYCLNLCYHTMTNIVYTTVYTKHMCNVPPLLQATDTFLETIALVARPSSFSSDSWGKLQRA